MSNNISLQVKDVSICFKYCAWFKGSQCYLSYIFVCRVVKRSSYRLNLLILVGVCIGFSGTILHVIVLDDDMHVIFTTTVCNVSGLKLRFDNNILLRRLECGVTNQHLPLLLEHFQLKYGGSINCSLIKKLMKRVSTHVYIKCKRIIIFHRNIYQTTICS